MTTPITCAACGHTMSEPAARVDAIVVCPECGASSVVLPDGTTRRAIGDDTSTLSADDLQVLRKARGRIARKDRK